MNTMYKILTISSPLFINILLIIKYLNSDDIFYLKFFYILLGSSFFNHFLKSFIFKPLMGNSRYPIIGIGQRPVGAKNCGLFFKNNDKLATSYGMPSGHSQEVATFSTISILKILDSQQVFSLKVFEYFILILFTIFIAHSRIYLGCHTLQQTIIGSMIGIFIGYKSYKYT